MTVQFKTSYSLTSTIHLPQKRIAEDALRDAQRDDLLHAYGGTELAIMRKDIGVNEEREQDGTRHLVTLNNSGNAHPESHRQV